MNSSSPPEPARQAASSPRRADARRNHERVLAAAVEVFRAHGTQATVPQIAAKAQVGRATVYRSFPTKEDLLETITRLRLSELERRTAAALREADPEEAFRHYVLELFDVLAGDRLLAERLAETSSAAASSVLDTLVGVMDAAREAGRLREDVSLVDLRVLLCGAALQLVRFSERDPLIWRRYADMVVRGLSS